MPILLGTTALPGETPELPAGVAGVSASFIDPAGVEWPLTDPGAGWVTLDGVAGVGAPAVELVSDAHPRGGARLRDVYTPARVITWPLLVWGTTPAQYATRWRTLARAWRLTQRRGPGWLRITRPGSDARQIPVVLQAGFEGEPDATHVQEPTTLSLWCPDPMWRTVAPIVLAFRTATPRRFLTAYPSLSPGRVLGAATVTNPGDETAWPVVRLTGPAAALTATHASTGESYTLTRTLTAGQTITVTTDPGTVRGPAGEVITGALNWPGAVLWGLLPGDNPVTLAVAGANTGTTVEFEFHPRMSTS